MNYIFTIDQTRLSELLEYYKDFETSTDTPNTLVVFRSPDLVISVYKTLKVMIQGTDAFDEYQMWAEMLGFEPDTEKKTPVAEARASEPRSIYYNSSSLGSDEVGTGDFYGPIVVCTTFVDKSRIPELEQLGIKDSKKMSDETIRAVGAKLIDLLPHALLVVDNKKYNELVKSGYNMNKIKAYLHNHAIKKCLQKVKGTYDYVILDQFCEPNLYYSYLQDVDAFHKITFLTQGESSHMAVAAASVIARYTFLHEMDALSEKIGIVLPLGASVAVDLIGKRIVLEKGFDFLNDIAKMNFKNAEKIRDLIPKH